MKIYNAFGITPTNSFVSAGSDYYIPNLTVNSNDKRKIYLAYSAFEKSYHKTADEINRIANLFNVLYNHPNQTHNLVHLYLALYNQTKEEIEKELSLEDSILYFIKNYVVYDQERDVVGIKLKLNDTLFINSGIKIALDSILTDQMKSLDMDKVSMIDMIKSLGIGVAGLYVNKSGRGNAGFDVRACLVDEDYSGYVHLSLAYCKDLYEDGQNIIYCGDKITQMMLIPVFHTQYEEISGDEYDDMMRTSERGDNGFGSQDIAHN